MQDEIPHSIQLEFSSFDIEVIRKSLEFSIEKGFTTNDPPDVNMPGISGKYSIKTVENILDLFKISEEILGNPKIKGLEKKSI